MTKVPPKIPPPPSGRPRRTRAEEGRAPKRPGSLLTDGEEEPVDPLTMSERLDQEREALEEHLELWNDGGQREERDKEERSEDEEAFRHLWLKSGPAVQRKQEGKQSGDQQKHQSPEDLRQQAKLRQAGGLADGFERKGGVDPVAGQLGTSDAKRADKGLALATPAPPPPPLGMRLGSGGFGAAMKFLNDAREPGGYFQFFDPNGAGAGGTLAQHSEDERELQAAVEEARRLYGELRGVVQVGPGRDEDGALAVLILAGKGFCESSMRSIPETVHRFRTLVGVPYELLPLRRI